MKLGDRVEFKNYSGCEIVGIFKEDGVYFQPGLMGKLAAVEFLNLPAGQHLPFRKEHNLTETEPVFIVGYETAYHAHLYLAAEGDIKKVAPAVLDK